MRQIWPIAALLIAGLAGCATSDEKPVHVAAEPVWVAATGDDFFAGAMYNSSLVDLSKLSAPIYDILPPVETWFTASDGMRMNNAVYRPDTTEPVPVFINFSPYWGDTAMTRGDNFAKYMIDNFVPRGYAVVLSAVRGTGHSEGCFEVASDRESLDVKEVVDFFAAQEWSNGNIGAGGKSYDSTSQNGMIAKFPSDNLKAVFHVSGITDMYRYTFYNGLPTRSTSGTWTAGYSVGQGTDEGFDDVESLQRLTGDASCTENPETVAMPVAAQATGAMNDYWIERDWTRSIGQSNWAGSIFFYHGFHDWNVQPAHILPWLDNIPEQINVKTWLHQDRENSGHLYPMRTDWNLTMLRWLDSELKGIDTGFWDEPRAELQGTDLQWRAQNEWPSQTNITAFKLNGAVLFSAEDQAYRSDGAPVIMATVTPTNLDPVFVAKLYDVGPNGRTMVNEAVMRLIYHDSLDVPAPIVVGRPMQIEVWFYASDDVLEQGHRWEVTFQESPSHSIALPNQLANLAVDVASVEIDMVLVPASQGLLTWQPKPMPCIAC